MTFLKKCRMAAIALTALAMLSLAACNGGAAEEPADPGAGQPPAEQPADPGTAETPPVAIPAEERVIDLLSWWTYLPQEEPDPATVSDYLSARMFWDNLQRVQQEFNVQVNSLMVDFGELLPLLTTSVLAGNPAADMMLIGAPQIFSAMLGDLIMPASQFTTPGADLLGANDFVRTTAVFDGEIWAFDRQEPWPHGHGLGINLGIINEIGVENPIDLFNRGEWTWDALREIMITATRDTDGDGAIDQFGISGQPGDIINLLIATNNGMLVDEPNRAYGFSHPNTIQALEFAFDIFNTYNVWFYDAVSGDEMGDWRRNMFSFQDGRSALFVGATWAFAEYEGGVPFDFAFVPFPQGPSGTGEYMRMTGFTQGIVIPVGVQNPDLVYEVFEQIMRWPGDDPWLAHEGILEYARGIFLTEEDVQRMLLVGERAKFDVGMAIYGYYWVLGDFARSFRTGEMTVAQAVETFRGPRQDMLDTAFAR